MWIPRWAGESYAKLYDAFGSELFGLNDALGILRSSIEMTKVALNKLHRESLLMIFERGRPKSYRLMDPENFIALASGKVKKAEIPQERYLKLIYDCCRALRKGIDLTSLAIYGSVARGTAGETSDIDFLVISEDFEGTLSRRIDLLRRAAAEEVEPELAFLRRKGLQAFLSFYPLRRAEAEEFPLMMLDMTEDAKIVFDEDRFLVELFSRLRSRLSELGAKRVRLKSGQWYWDLRPGYRPLEAIPI